MFVPFDSLPEHARIWIYQADRKFTAEENELLKSKLKTYCDRWMAHGQPLETSFTIQFDRFLILGVNENVHAPSGCSIDDSVRIVKELGTSLQIDWFNRSLVAFQIAGDIRVFPLAELKQQYQAGGWNENTVTFNNVVTTKGDLSTKWMIPASNSWLKKYVPGEKIFS